MLGLHLSHRADPRTAIAAYESARRARVDRVVKWGKRMGDTKAAGPVGFPSFPLVTALGSRPSVVRRQAWLYTITSNGVVSRGLRRATRHESVRTPSQRALPPRGASRWSPSNSPAC